MHTTFINYTEEDEILAKRIYTDVLARGVRAWVAAYDTAPGDNDIAVERAAMEASTHVVVLLTRKYTRNPLAVELTEAAEAAGKTIISLIADSGIKQEGAIKLKRRYAEGIEALVKELPAEEEPLSELPALQLGHEAYFLEDFEGAVEAYQAAGAESVEALNGLGASYNALRQHEQAVEVLTQAIALDDGIAKVYRSRSLAYSGLGEHEKALADDEKGLALDPTNPRVWSSHGMTLLALNRNEDAQKAIEKALELNPDEAFYYYQLALIANKQENYEQALRYMEQALEVEPDLIDAVNGRRMVLGYLGRYDEVLEEANREIRKNPRKGGAYVTRSLIHFYLEDYEATIKDATAALERGQGVQPAPFFNRAIAHWKLGNQEAAQQDMLEAIAVYDELRTPAGIRANAESDQTRDPALEILAALQESGQLERE